MAGFVEWIDTMSALINMSRSELVSTAGAAFGFLGGTLLAFAASAELRAHRLAISALQVETGALVEAIADSNKPLYRISGTEKHIERGTKRNAAFTFFGIVFLLISFFLTILSFFASRGTAQ